LVIVRLSIFAGGRSGTGVLFEPIGVYIFGFILAALK